VALICVSVGIFPPPTAVRAEEERFLAPIGPPDPNAIPIYTAQDLDNVRNNLSGSYVLMNDIDLSGFNGGEWIPIGTDRSNAFAGIFDGQGHVIWNLRITGDRYHANGLFAYIYGAQLRNVGMEGTYIDVSSDSGSLAGGIVSDSSYSYIGNCYNTGYISVSCNSNAYVGGILAYSHVYSNVSPTNISNCYNTGYISAVSVRDSGAYVGGIAGFFANNDSIISNCHNTGDIYSYSSHSLAGGIVGRFSSSISNCYNTGNITSSTDSNYHNSNLGSEVGGIAGSATSPAIIDSCYNTGNITLSVSFSFFSSDQIYSNAGGIAGSSSSIMSNCYNTGDINSSSNYHPLAGGIVGTSNSSPNPTSISNCYSSGDIIASTSSSNAFSYAGGIAGYSHLRSISDCVVLSALIVAENTDSWGRNGRQSNLISVMDDLSNNLALSGIAGDAINDADRLISEAEARSQSTYEALGWDFDTVWEMVSGYDYPQLRMLDSGDGELIPTVPPIQPTPTATPAPTAAPTAAPGSGYPITASAGTGGRISPAGTVAVPIGGGQTFSVTANSGYRISDVLADGVSVGAVSSYTFENVTGSHSIEARFALSGASGGDGVSNGSGGSGGDPGGNLAPPVPSAPAAPSASASPTASPVPLSPRYIYDSVDPGADVTLSADRLAGVTDLASAIQLIRETADRLTSQQKGSATAIDRITLFAEEALAQVASAQIATGDEIIVDQVSVRALEARLQGATGAVEQALAAAGVITARELSMDAKFITQPADTVVIVIDPSAVDTSASHVRVETPDYALTFTAEGIRANTADGPLIITVTDVTASTAVPVTLFPDAVSQDAAFLSRALWTTDADSEGSSYTRTADTGVKVYHISFSKPVAAKVKLSLTPAFGNPDYQAITNAAGNPVGGKYNPVAGKLEARIGETDTYTVKENRKDFADIAGKTREMQDAIRILASKGIIAGTSPTEFSPDAPINRAEIAALIVRTLAKYEGNAEVDFADVQRSDWFFASVGSAKKHGIMGGVSETTFAPRVNIPKDQIVVVSARVLRNEMKYKNPTNAGAYLSAYTDQSAIPVWALTDIALATRENLVVKRTDGTFEPTFTMARGDAAIILYRLFNRIW
jgi:hypothetical protein